MPYSYNGWYASQDLPTRPLVVAGEAFVPGVLDNDDVWEVLRYVAQQMHERVEPIVRDDWHQMDDWGYNYRLTTGDTNSLSCHSSGTAIDYNSTRHPYDVSPYRNFSQGQIDEIHRIIADLPIVWGGDYRYHPDAMHFEIMGSRDAVAAAATRIRNMGKDWFDMATKEELQDAVRSEIRNELRDPAFIGKVVDEVWRREFNATNANGTAVKKPARELLKESWEILKTLKK